MAYTNKINDKDYNGTFSKRLRKIMEEQNCTQKTLGEKIGKTYQAVGAYMRGETQPTLAIAQSIADYFNVSLDYLSGRSEVPSRDENIQKINEMTGLSPQSIINLNAMNIGEFGYMKIINSILSSKYFIPFMNSVESYLEKENNSDIKNIISDELLIECTHIDRFDEIRSEVWKKITQKAYIEEFMWKIITEYEERNNAKK